MSLAIIIACETGFWVFLLSGPALQYLARRPPWGPALVAMAPLVGLDLLGANVVDLRSRGHAASAHALSAFSIGFSVAYGQRLITWADRKFARRHRPHHHDQLHHLASSAPCAEESGERSPDG